MIGIFDSGLGGLTAYKEVRRLLPDEDIVYFGDTGRVPYGTRSKETITKYALQDMRFLMTRQLDAVLVACGTVTSTAIDVLRANWDIPIIGVIDGAARTAVRLTKNKKIGVVATSATINSHSFGKRLAGLDPELKISERACPLFVPLVESGFISEDDEVPRLVAERYLADIKADGCDTLILGCTHYPVIAKTIAKVLPGVNIVSSSLEAAKVMAEVRQNAAKGSGATEFFVSDEPCGFETIASIFLDTRLEHDVTRIDIEKY